MFANGQIITISLVLLRVLIAHLYYPLYDFLNKFQIENNFVSIYSIFLILKVYSLFLQSYTLEKALICKNLRQESLSATLSQMLHQMVFTQNRKIGQNAYLCHPICLSFPKGVENKTAGEEAKPQAGQASSAS